MSLDIAKQIISKGVLGVSSPFKIKTPSYDQPETTSTISDSSVDVKDYGDKSLTSQVPKKVTKKGDVTTYTLPDGSEFSLDDRGRPVISSRSLSTEEKKKVRTGDGTFKNTQEEVDHKISIALGGTDSPGNLEALKSSKTISQTVFDALTGKSRLPGEYKPANRQEGKMIVEWKAIDKYEAGDITLFEAMAAVQHYDDQNLVASFLHEEPPKQTVIQKIGEFLNPKAGGPVVAVKEKATDFIKDKLAESRKTGILNDLMGSIGGKHYFDKEDGRALIFEVGENLDKQEKVVAEEIVRQQKGVIESPFLALPPKTQAGLVITAPIRWTAGSMARLLIDAGLEATSSDARFTPETSLQAMLFGKEDFVRLSEAGDVYGMAETLVQKKLEEKGIASDKAHTAGMASALLIGSVLENPFFSFGKKPAKEALEVALRKSLERELGSELSKKALKELAFETERITGLKGKVARSTAIQEFVEKVKVDPEAIIKLKPRQEVFGVGTGLEVDEVTGEVRIDPAKAALGIFGVGALKKVRNIKSLSKAQLDKEIEKRIEVFRKEAGLLAEKEGAGVSYRKVTDATGGVNFVAKDFNLNKAKGSMRRQAEGLKKEAYSLLFENDQDFKALVDRQNELLAKESISAGAKASERPLTTDELFERLDKKVSTFPLLNQSSQKTVRQGLEELAPARKAEGTPLKEPIESRPTLSQRDNAYEETVAQTQTPVKDKINIIDYVRTPERVLEKIGFGDEAKLLRQGYESYLKELPKNIDKISKWAKLVPSKESNSKIFNYLDGKEVTLNETEAKVAGEIKTWLSQWADRLGLPEDKRIASYITHLFDEELIAKEFDEDLAKIIANKLPGEVYDPFLEKRLGAKGYRQDTWAALDAYAKRATRKVNMDPALEAIKEKAGGSLERAKIEQSQYEYLKKYVDQINLRPTKLDTLIDNAVKSTFVGYKMGQRPVSRFTKFLRQMTYRGMLGLNPSSALRNLSQGINTYAVLGEKYTAIGYAKLFNRGAVDELREAGVLAENFIQDRILSSTKKKIQKLDKGLFIFFDTAEKINRGAAYFGAKAKALKAGKSAEEAVEYAKGIVRKTQFSFGSIDTPLAMQSDLIKTLTQFQTYSIKQVEFLTEMIKDKNFVGLLRYAVAGMAFVYTFGQAFGMEPKDLIPSFRLGTPPSLKLPVEATKAVLDVPDKYGQDRDVQTKIRDVGKSAVGLFPAGTQIKKTVEGIKSIQEGGSYTKSGNLQFEQGQTLPEKAQAVLFGKYASDEAKAYFNKTAPSQSEVEYLRLTTLPPDERKGAYNALKAENPSLAAQVKKIGEDKKSGITDKEKEIRSLGVQNGQRAEAVVEALNGLTSEEKKALWKDWKNKKIITETVAEQVKALLSAK
mgnify:CR=1 FL=1